MLAASSTLLIMPLTTWKTWTITWHQSSTHRTKLSAFALTSKLARSWWPPAGCAVRVVCLRRWILGWQEGQDLVRQKLQAILLLQGEASNFEQQLGDLVSGWKKMPFGQVLAYTCNHAFMRTTTWKVKPSIKVYIYIYTYVCGDRLVLFLAKGDEPSLSSLVGPDQWCIIFSSSLIAC